MASPLAIEQRNELNEKKKKFLNPASRYIDPKNEVHVFRKIQHWTLEIDGRCYELSPDTKKKLKAIKKATDMVKPHWIGSTHWKTIRESKEIEPEKRLIGRTDKSHEEIWTEVNYIWTDSNHDWYGFFTQNCQNFAHMLHERIAIKIPDDEKESWQRIPDPIGYRLADGATLALATKLAYGSKAAYAASTVGTTTGGSAAGGTGTAAIGSTTASGGTTAASSRTATLGSTTAGGTTAGSSSTAALGTTTASSTTTGSSAVTTTQASVAKGIGAKSAGVKGLGAKTAALMHGSHAAGNISLGAKAAGVGTKAAAVMQGGHAAALGGGMAKAGMATAYFHPVSGIVVTGGLAYLAYRGRKSKRWTRKNKKSAEMNVFDLLDVEDVAFEQAERPDEVVDEGFVADSDTEIDDEFIAELQDGEVYEHVSTDLQVDGELADDLELHLVSSEPGRILEEDEDVPSVQDKRRTQTTG
ncbi:MAG: hypothetical protein Q9186_000719 [Xanthomendoza sp. 1 TL-2023]